MTISPASNSSLELTMSMPGFSSSGDHHNRGGLMVVRDLDINQVPEEEEEWMTVGGGGGGEEDEEESMIDGSSSSGPPRKKLRLTKEQSRLLEERFRQHHTLNPRQKEALAAQLNLRPRQVEVWFQNRRARSKLKQTEMECEYLKRWFGSLTEQNRRLQREVEELRATKVGQPTVTSPHTCEPLPAATLTMCPRCERVTTTTGGAAATTTTTVSAAATLSSNVGPHALQSRQSSLPRLVSDAL